MPKRKVEIIKDELYHVYTKSMQDIVVFRDRNDYRRMLDEVIYYIAGKRQCQFSLRSKDGKRCDQQYAETPDENKLAQILAYCLMPTHVHFILKEISDNGISKFMGLILHSYSKYFNVKNDRKGTLWESRFGNTLIESDEQLLHITRYVHLNPVTAHIVNDPIDWEFSSYKEYLNRSPKSHRICDISFLDITNGEYEKFVLEHIDYQRALAATKNDTSRDCNPGL